ncbi:MAG: pseudouridine synthase [Bacteroidetes bacterium]|nr:pseudouridine synthase [Bacteroidota bacterium]
MERPRRPAGKRRENERSGSGERPKSSSYPKRRTEGDGTREEKPYNPERRSSRPGERPKSSPYPKRRTEGDSTREEKPYDPERRSSRPGTRTKSSSSHGKRTSSRMEEEGDLIRLNRYIANSGICSRREADKLIEAGAVKVNGKVVTELGTKVSRSDKITYGDQSLSREKPRYLLLNKPKGFITTTDDPQNRKTVMNLIAHACKERIYPVGRLDRNTTGLLFFTNDGEIAKKLSHPKYGIKKIYHVGLDHYVTMNDMKKILEGIELEDGLVKADAIEYVGDGKDKKEIGIELHTGQNRVVRRIFEQLGYKVVKLDRVYYAGFTKKNLPRGEWRFLEEKEINMLKMIHS